MNPKKLLSALLLILIAQNAFALTESIEAKTFSDGLTEITHFIRLNEEREAGISILSENPLELRVSCQTGTEEKKCSYSIKGKEISLTELQNIKSIKANYSTSSLTGKTGEKWILEVPYNESTDSIKFSFPENTRITGYEPEASVYFDEANLIVLWKKTDLIQKNKTIKAEYSFGLKTKNENMPSPGNAIIIWAAILITLSIIIASVFLLKDKLIQKPAAASLSEQQKELLNALSLKEKELMHLIAEKNGLTQKTLLQKSSFPKATLSRILKYLEQKDFIKIVQYGYTNQIYLSEWFRQKK